MNDVIRLEENCVITWQCKEQLITAAMLDGSAPPTVPELVKWLEQFAAELNKVVVPTLKCLTELALKTENLRLKAMTIEMKADLYDGGNLAQAIYNFRWCKLPIVAALIGIGEECSDIAKMSTLAAKLYKCEFKLSENSPLGSSNKMHARMFFMFSILLEAGLPILRALKLLQEETESPVFKIVFKCVCEKREEGYNLSLALSSVGIFVPAIIHAIREHEQRTQRQEDYATFFSSWFEKQESE